MRASRLLHILWFDAAKEDPPVLDAEAWLGPFWRGFPPIISSSSAGGIGASFMSWHIWKNSPCVYGGGGDDF